MKNAMIKTLAATVALSASVGAVAATNTALDAVELPTSVAGYSVEAPIYTRELIGYDYSGDSVQAVYGDIKGVVVTRENLGRNFNLDESVAVLGDIKGVAVDVELNLQQSQKRFNEMGSPLR